MSFKSETGRTNYGRRASPAPPRDARPQFSQLRANQRRNRRAVIGASNRRLGRVGLAGMAGWGVALGLQLAQLSTLPKRQSQWKSTPPAKMASRGAPAHQSRRTQFPDTASSALPPASTRRSAWLPATRQPGREAAHWADLFSSASRSAQCRRLTSPGAQMPRRRDRR